MARSTFKEYLIRVTNFLSENRRKEPRENPTDRRTAERQPFQVVIGSKFNESLLKHERVFSDLREKLKKFVELKQADPLRNKYGKHDSSFATGTPLAGFMHCHLRDDAILIYTLKNQSINLVLIVSHAEIDRSRGASKLAAALNA